MAHYHLSSDGKYRGLPYGEGDQWSLVDYRFGRGRMTRSRGRVALNLLNGYLKSLIEAIAVAKLRRMRRELDHHDVRLARSGVKRMAGSRDECDRKA
jgi:hypothetical protein